VQKEKKDEMRGKMDPQRFLVFAEPAPITSPTKKITGTGCLVSLHKYD
jgi:hypothetical protein